MKVTKAVITAAGRSQRSLPLQTLVDRDGARKSVLSIILDEALRADIDDICVVISPDDERAYREAAGERAQYLSFVPQPEALGYGHAVYCARHFIGGEPFLHMVGDHVYVSDDALGCARQLVDVAHAQNCSVSAVQPTREHLLPYFGTIGGHRLRGTKDRYVVERVAEKPTPTEAEQSLMIPGLRAGHYLCFFGMHVLTPASMELLVHHVEGDGQNSVHLSTVLDELARREQYMALEIRGRRYPLDEHYGVMTAQLALALSGRDRDEVLTGLVELLAQHHPAPEAR